MTNKKFSPSVLKEVGKCPRDQTSFPVHSGRMAAFRGTASAQGRVEGAWPSPTCRTATRCPLSRPPLRWRRPRFRLALSVGQLSATHYLAHSFAITFSPSPAARDSASRRDDRAPPRRYVQRGAVLRACVAGQHRGVRVDDRRARALPAPQGTAPSWLSCL